MKQEILNTSQTVGGQKSKQGICIKERVESPLKMEQVYSGERFPEFGLGEQVSPCQGTLKFVENILNVDD